MKATPKFILFLLFCLNGYAQEPSAECKITYYYEDWLLDASVARVERTFLLKERLVVQRSYTIKGDHFMTDSFTVNKGEILRVENGKRDLIFSVDSFHADIPLKFATNIFTTVLPNSDTITSVYSEEWVPMELTQVDSFAFLGKVASMYSFHVKVYKDDILDTEYVYLFSPVLGKVAWRKKRTRVNEMYGIHYSLEGSCQQVLKKFTRGFN